MDRLEPMVRGWLMRVALLAGLAAGSGLTGCGYESAYERAVYDAEPVYCYRTLADSDCWRDPDPTADRRLVNYYGPSPRRTEAPMRTPIRLEPPPPADVEATGRTEEGEIKGEGPAGRPIALTVEALRLGGEEPGAAR